MTHTNLEQRLTALHIAYNIDFLFTAMRYVK